MGQPMSRRTLLRGAGAALALPFLDAMRPRGAHAAEPEALRAFFVYVPNGVHVPAWTPQDPQLATLPPTLEPLAELREQVLVLGGLTLDGARSHGDGPGDHARALASFLTCTHPVKTGGANFRCGVSVDQVAAAKLGRHTQLASLELGTERSRQSGACDSGYACAYSSNLAWSTPTTPLGKEIDPRRVFDRLVGSEGRLSPAEREQLRTRRRSVLDLVLAEARDLERRLGRCDRSKLDEYLNAVRAVERRIAESTTEDGPEEVGLERPPGIPRRHRRHVRLMYELAALAFRCDLTRVGSFLVGNAGSNRSHRFLDVPEGYHRLSHHGGDQAKQAKLQRIDRFHVEELARFLQTLREIPEGEGNLLDRSLIVYGSGIRDGNRHDHGDLPILLCGGGGGRLRAGRWLRFPKETPLANLYVWILRALGVHAPGFGDASGPLTGLES